MNKLIATLLSVLLTILLSTTAFAADGDTVTKTFELTLRGMSPPTRSSC